MGIGLVLFFVLRRQNRHSQAIVAAAIAGTLAVAAFLVATLTTTDRETLRDRTRRLVGLTAKADITGLRSLMAPSIGVSDPRNVVRNIVFPDVSELEPVLRHIELHMNGDWKLKEWSIGLVEATLDGPQVARTQVRVRTTPEAAPFPVTSWWRIDWHKIGAGDDAWKAFAIEPLAWELPLSLK